jgi:mRNA interferase HigB
MRLVAYSSLQDFWTANPRTEASLRVWATVIRSGEFRTMDEIQARFPKAKVLNGERVRFEVAGGDFRLIAAIYFPAQTVWVKFVGSHAEYDRIDALTVDDY